MALTATTMLITVAQAESTSKIVRGGTYMHFGGEEELTNNGDGTYSSVYGTGVLHNGILYIQSEVNGNGSSSIYEYDPVTWLPTKEGWTAPDSWSITNYEINGNTKKTVSTNSNGDYDERTYTYLDDYDFFAQGMEEYLINKEKYTTSKYCANGSSCQTAKAIYTYDDNGNMIGHATMQSNRDGILDMIEVTTVQESSRQPFYENGKPTRDTLLNQITWQFTHGTYNYDLNTGSLLNLTNDDTGEIIESYIVSPDGKITVYSGDKDNGGIMIGVYGNFEDYIFSSAGENLHLRDILDSDFGTIGYVPSRLSSSGTNGDNISGSANSSRTPKRIYTVEEASKLSKPTGNTFKIRYK